MVWGLDVARIFLTERPRVGSALCDQERWRLLRHWPRSLVGFCVPKGFPVLQCWVVLFLGKGLGAEL